MRYALAVLSAVASFALARPAGALIIVDYAFDSTSKLSIVSPPVDIPPQGTLTGEVRITYTSNSAGEIVSGPATLDILDLSADLNVSTTVGTPVTVTGPASATLRSPVAGTLDGDQLSFGSAMGASARSARSPAPARSAASPTCPRGAPFRSTRSAPSRSRRSRSRRFTGHSRAWTSAASPRT